jgi:hypothetical protein
MEDEEIIEYSTKNLQEQFNLALADKFALIPLFDTIVCSFAADLNKNYAKYGITDLMNRSDGYREKIDVVVDGKIVKLGFSYADIDVEDEEESIYRISRISFDGEKNAALKILNELKEFVDCQNLEDLIKLAAKKLDKEKTYHLNSETYTFYSRYFSKA